MANFAQCKTGLIKGTGKSIPSTIFFYSLVDNEVILIMRNTSAVMLLLNYNVDVEK